MRSNRKFCPPDQDSGPLGNPSPNLDTSTDSKSYALSGKIMLSAIVILLFVVILMVFLQLYARWYLHRARRRHQHLRRSRRRTTTIVFGSPSDPSAPRGLDPALLKSLPVFVFKPDTHPDPIDCAVCLSEFEENESGRILPNCNHNFHIECIDMWFHSHSTCPLCRAPVELPLNPTGVVVEILDASSSSGSKEGHGAGSSGSKKPVGFVGITVEVPLRGANSGFDSESGTAESTPSQFRSPVGRMLSRILSRERRPVTPTSCGDDVAEVDLERGDLTRG